MIPFAAFDLSTAPSSGKIDPIQNFANSIIGRRI
jgi:hypothetical protein